MKKLKKANPWYELFMAYYVTAKLPDDLANTGEVQRCYAIRVGLAMAAGMTRKQAENYAATSVKMGRHTKQ